MPDVYDGDIREIFDSEPVEDIGPVSFVDDDYHREELKRYTKELMHLRNRVRQLELVERQLVSHRPEDIWEGRWVWKLGVIRNDVKRGRWKFRDLLNCIEWHQEQIEKTRVL